MSIFSRNQKILKLHLNGEITSKETKFSLSTTSITKIKEHLLEVKQTNSNNYQGILLKINSPGGAAATSEELARLILKLRKEVPIVSSISDYACSGAYMIAAASNYIFANTMSWTGSIGVIMTLPNYQELSKMLGVSVKTIKSGKMKDLGNPFREMTSEEEQYLEMLVRNAHTEFVDFIKQVRPRVENLIELSDGRVLDAKTALENNFIDALGTEDDALNYLITEILHGDANDFSIVDTAAKPNFLRKLLDMNSPITIKLELPSKFF